MYDSKKEAEEAKAKLSRRGISSYAQVDKPSGIVPFLTPVVRLYVRAKDHEKARTVLKGEPPKETEKPNIVTRSLIPEPSVPVPPLPVTTEPIRVPPKPAEPFYIPRRSIPEPIPKMSRKRAQYSWPVFRFPSIHIPFSFITLVLFLLFLVTRVYRLTQIPMFNDEAIYLDWGWREITKPSMLFYSLYDAKQPLLMWLFGISEVVFTDQLFAGRIVTVLFSVGTFLGIWKIGKKILTKTETGVALFLYTWIPIFAFFDRQALMEGAISCIIVWSFYCYLQVTAKPKTSWSILWGILIGIGLFIKSSIFLPEVIFLCLLFMDLRSQKQKTERLIHIFVLFGTAFCFLLPLFLQPMFWKTLASTNRFVFPVGELFSFPFRIWAMNIVVLIEALFAHVTIGIVGTIVIASVVSQKMIRRISYIIGLLLFLLLFFSKGLTERYIVSYISLLVIPAAWGLLRLWKTRLSGKLGVCIIIAPVLLLTYLQIFSIENYFRIVSQIPHAGLQEYYKGYTSGYGITDVGKYLSEVAKNQKIFVGVALNTGNPQSAILTYFHKNPQVLAGYFDASMFTQDLSQYDCVTTSLPIYFVSRDEQLAGLDKFLFKRISYANPYSNTSVGIYRSKVPCKQNAFYVTLQMDGAE
jgi:hypothetical protein